MLVALALPWLSFECSGIRSESITGMDFISGERAAEKLRRWERNVGAIGASEDEPSRVLKEWQLYLRIITGLAVAGVCFSVVQLGSRRPRRRRRRRRNRVQVCGFLALAGLAGCGYFWYEVSGAAAGVVNVQWKLGFWLACISFGIAAVKDFTE